MERQLWLGADGVSLLADGEERNMVISGAASSITGVGPMQVECETSRGHRDAAHWVEPNQKPEAQSSWNQPVLALPCPGPDWKGPGLGD